MTSSTAHGVMAVNSWMLPPVVGYSTEVSHEDVNTLSTFNLANLTAKKKKKTCVWVSFQELITNPINSWSFKIEKREREREPTLRLWLQHVIIRGLRLNPIIGLNVH